MVQLFYQHPCVTASQLEILSAHQSDHIPDSPSYIKRNGLYKSLPDVEQRQPPPALPLPLSPPRTSLPYVSQHHILHIDVHDHPETLDPAFHSSARFDTDALREAYVKVVTYESVISTRQRSRARAETADGAIPDLPAVTADIWAVAGAVQSRDGHG